MKNFLALFLAFAVTIGVTALAANETAVQSAQTNNSLVALLPASDAVVSVNMKRLLSDALPQILASQPNALVQLNTEIDKFKTKTGLDIRSFEQIVIGATLNHGANNQFDVEPTILLRGSFDTNATLTMGKVAANGKFRQETVGGKTVYIFNLPPDQAKKPDATANNSKNNDPIDKLMNKMMSGEIAVVSLDANTMAVAKPAQMRLMLTDTTKNRISSDLTNLANRNSNSIINFAGNLPADMSSLANTGNGQFDRIIGSLRQIFGSMDLNGGNALMTLAASTAQEAQAEELLSTLNGLQSLGKVMLSNKNDEKTQILVRVVENLKITRSSTEVQLQATLPQSDINKLMSNSSSSSSANSVR